jgi:hypothetical protein
MLKAAIEGWMLVECGRERRRKGLMNWMKCGGTYAETKRESGNKRCGAEPLKTTGLMRCLI